MRLGIRFPGDESEKAMSEYEYWILRTAEETADMLNRRSTRAELNKVMLTPEREV